MLRCCELHQWWPPPYMWLGTAHWDRHFRAKEPPPNSHPKIIPNIFVNGFEVANGSLTKSFFSIGAWFPVLTWQRLKGMDGALLIDSLPLIDSDFYSVRMHHMMSIWWHNWITKACQPILSFFADLLCSFIQTNRCWLWPYRIVKFLLSNILHLIFFCFWISMCHSLTSSNFKSAHGLMARTRRFRTRLWSFPENDIIAVIYNSILDWAHQFLKAPLHS